ncbi:hypothetical protein BH09PSE5_BH09PSE5_45530 [soil metagenome]
MANKARITGVVEYREGDGQLIAIPVGECEVTVGELDVTISWHDDDTTGSTAIPIPDYKRLLAEKKIELVQ